MLTYLAAREGYRYYKKQEAKKTYSKDLARRRKAALLNPGAKIRAPLPDEHVTLSAPTSPASSTEDLSLVVVRHTGPPTPNKYGRRDAFLAIEDVPPLQSSRHEKGLQLVAVKSLSPPPPRSINTTPDVLARPAPPSRSAKRTLVTMTRAFTPPALPPPRRSARAAVESAKPQTTNTLPDTLGSILAVRPRSIPLPKRVSYRMTGTASDVSALTSTIRPPQPPPKPAALSSAGTVTLAERPKPPPKPATLSSAHTPAIVGKKATVREEVTERARKDNQAPIPPPSPSVKPPTQECLLRPIS